MATFSDAVINVYLNKGQADKGIKDLQKSFERMGRDIKSTIGALGLGMLGKRIFSDAFDNFKKFSDYVTMYKQDAEKVSGYANKMSLVGQDMSGAVDDLRKISDLTRDADAGGQKYAEIVEKLHLNLRDANGQWKDSVTLANDIRKAVQDLPDGLKDLTVLKDMLGLSDEFVVMARKSPKEYAKLVKEADKMRKLNNEQVKKFDELKGKWGKFKNTLQTTAISVMSNMGPLIDKLTGLLDKFNSLSPQTQNIIVGTLGAFAGLKILGTLMSPLNLLWDIFKFAGGKGGTSVQAVFSSISTALMGLLKISGVLASLYAIVEAGQELLKILNERPGQSLDRGKKDRESWNWAEDWWKIGKGISAGGNWLAEQFVGKDMTPAEIQQRVAGNSSNVNNNNTVINMNVSTPDASSFNRQEANNLVSIINRQNMQNAGAIR